MAADLDLTSFDPLDPETLKCPVPHYARLRAEAPVQYIQVLDMYLVTRHDLVLEVLRDPVTYSSQRDKFPLERSAENRELLAAVAADGYPRISTLLRIDPPAHTRYRRLVSKAFSPRAVARLEPVVRAVTTRLIDSWIDDVRVEFVEQFAVPLPLEVIAIALNVPDDRLDDFKRWSDDIVVGTGAAPPIERMVEAERGLNEFQHYFAEALERRRTEPRDDLLTDLLNARIDDDDPEVSDKRPLDLPELLSLIQQLLAGGNETTTKLLAEMMRLLGEHPEQWRQLQQDPSLVPKVVEESLRLASVAQGMLRIATRDVRLGDVDIPARARVTPMFGSANRDDDVFHRPDEFDPRRGDLGEHLAFGKGTHYCIGANLTRLEARVALEELARRLDSFSLSPSNDYTYSPSFILRGLVELDLDLVKS